LYTYDNKKDDKKDNTISSLVPVMLDVLNLKQLIISVCNLGCRSSLLMLAESRGCIYVYMSNTEINYVLHVKQATSSSVFYKKTKYGITTSVVAKMV